MTQNSMPQNSMTGTSTPENSSQISKIRVCGRGCLGKGGRELHAAAQKFWAESETPVEQISRPQPCLRACSQWPNLAVVRGDGREEVISFPGVDPTDYFPHLSAKIADLFAQNPTPDTPEK